jgi:hypothetical protein
MRCATATIVPDQPRGPGYRQPPNRNPGVTTVLKQLQHGGRQRPLSPRTLFSAGAAHCHFMLSMKSSGPPHDCEWHEMQPAMMPL